jgi:hypothetical protein
VLGSKEQISWKQNADSLVIQKPNMIPNKKENAWPVITEVLPVQVSPTWKFIEQVTGCS